MPDIQRYLDIGSRLVILVTFVLFVAALFFKGLGHDLLLEAGVFLVSLKLILMTNKNSVAAKQMNDRLDDLQTTLKRMESLLDSTRLSDLAVEPASKAMQPSDAAPGAHRNLR